jgi:hypothetical protein
MEQYPTEHGWSNILQSMDGAISYRAWMEQYPTETQNAEPTSQSKKSRWILMNVFFFFFQECIVQSLAV